jgi:predicted  nucleic acid-binding Zn-ribbon protein
MLKMFAALALAVCVSASVACSDDDNGGSTGVTNDREGFIQEAEDRLSDLRSELDRARDEISSADPAGEARQRADDLERRVNDIEADVEDGRNAGDEEWQALRDRLDESLNDAENTANDITSELGLD